MQMDIPKILGLDEGAGVRFGQSLGTRRLIDRAGTDGRFAAVVHDLGPRQLGAPVHTHSREDEYSLLLSGRLTVMLGDAVTEAGPGQLVIKPRGIPHAMWNSGDQPAQFIELISPAGFEEYFFEVARHFEDGHPERTAETAARYGLSIDLQSVATLIERHHLDPPQ
jgi:quercetin dioxygenase-like cupin family protein